MTARINITGYGAVSSAGWGSQSLFDSTFGARSCISELNRFPTYGCSTLAVGPVPERATNSTCPSRATAYATAATSEVLGMANLSPDDRLDAVVVGNHGERVLPSSGTNGTILTGTELAEHLRALTGATRGLSIYGACAGGALAIGAGVELIQAGKAQRILVGGADSLLREFDYLHFSGLYAMSTRACPPEEACCPFDRRRDGFVLSEGAGFLLLETDAAMSDRDASPLAVISGFGCAQNAYHIVASPPDARGPELAMRACLADSGRAPQEIGYINAHGTSTRDNDWCETLAIRQAFSSHADELLVSSSKSMLGHSMAAAGALELILTVEALRRQEAPPTINLHEPDDQCDLNYVPHASQGFEAPCAMSNSFGFGGHSSAVLVEVP